MTTSATLAPAAPWTRANAMRIRAKAWSAYPIGAALVHVSGGRVHVWDECASHFTTLHALTPRAEKRICAAYVKHVG